MAVLPEYAEWLVIRAQQLPERSIPPLLSELGGARAECRRSSLGTAQTLLTR